MKPARVVVVDFPWEYRNRHDSRKDNKQKKTKFGVGVAKRYNHGVMKEPQMVVVAEALKHVTTPDAYVFSWATKANLPLSIRVMEKAGWRYCTTAFVWAKVTRTGFFMGSGRYSFSNTEDLQLWRKPGAQCWHTNKGWRPGQIVLQPHPRDPHTHKIIHSRKPEAFQHLIDLWLLPQMAPDDVRLEVFATRDLPDWLCLGGDVTGNDILQDIAEYRSIII